MGRTASFLWTHPREEAAFLIAEDRLTDQAIADKLGICKRTLTNWKARPEFRLRVDEHVAEFKRLVRSRGLAILERRVDQMNDRWKRMQQVILERGASTEHGKFAGGATGLLVIQHKMLAEEIVKEAAVDTGLLKEMRELEKQASQELGQWAENTVVEHRDGSGIVDAIQRKLDSLAAAAGAAEVHPKPEPD